VAGSIALVLQAGSLVGIFTERDILRALAHFAKADLARISLVTQWMSRDPVTIRPDTTVAESISRTRTVKHQLELDRGHSGSASKSEKAPPVSSTVPLRVVFINPQDSSGVLLHGIDHGPYQDERHKERA